MPLPQQQQPRLFHPTAATTPSPSVQSAAAPPSQLGDLAVHKAGDEVRLRCCCDTPRGWKVTGDELHLQVFKELGFGGNSELYEVELLGKVTADGSMAAAGGEIAEAATADGLSIGTRYALKVPHRYEVALSAADQQKLSPFVYYPSLYRTFRLEQQVLCSLAGCYFNISCLAYGYAGSGSRQFPALLLPLAKHGDLQQLLASRPEAPCPMEPMRAWQVMWQAAGALKDCHEKAAAMYRDLKPENLLIFNEAEDGTLLCKPCDFGACRFLADDALGGGRRGVHGRD